MITASVNTDIPVINDSLKNLILLKLQMRERLKINIEYHVERLGAFRCYKAPQTQSYNNTLRKKITSSKNVC